MKKFFLDYEEWILGMMAFLILAIILIFVVIGITNAVKSTGSALNPPVRDEEIKFDFKTAEELNLGK